MARIDIELTEELKRYFDETGKAFIDHEGNEVLDPRKIKLTTGLGRPESLTEQVDRLVRHSLLVNQKWDKQRETFEEAEDFDVGEETDPVSQYELQEMVEEYPEQIPLPKEEPVEKEKDQEPDPQKDPAQDTLTVDENLQA